MKRLEDTLSKKLSYALFAGFLAGVIWFIGFRTILLPNQTVHYHANFALYINGQRDLFNSYVYYEEVAACTADKNDPHNRVHMHDNVNHVVHVHDSGVTWADFFANLGYALGDKSLETRDKVYISGQDGKTLSFTLNGQRVSSIADRVVGDTDRLLINYGTENDNDLSLRYATVEHDAAEVDKKADPAACGGAEQNGFWERLKRATWQASS